MQEPYSFSDPERHAYAMREVVETVMFTADDGQQFSGLHLNRDFSDQPAIVRLNAWMAAVSAPEQKYAAYQYAAANPDHPIVVIDMPSHGQSDNLTAAQRKEIFGKRSLELLGGAQAQAVSSRLTHAREAIAVGDSLGVRVAIDFARKAGELGVKPLALIGFEMVGLEKRRSAALSWAFFGTEWLRTKKVYRTPENQILEEAYELNFKNDLVKAEYEGTYSLLDVYKQDPTLLAFLIAKSPLAGNTGVAALEELLTNEPDMRASIVIGGLSSICRWQNIQPTVQQLQALYGERLSLDIWPNDSHGMSVAPQQPRMAAHVRDFIDQRGLL